MEDEMEKEVHSGLKYQDIYSLHLLENSNNGNYSRITTYQLTYLSINVNCKIDCEDF